ncbi:unnamed protein product [Amoebophrya sp. A120]|nr:unnamed protein product [Amoebophrya sp. A120]|eukprot:GSA120T00024893001.1
MFFDIFADCLKVQRKNAAFEEDLTEQVFEQKHDGDASASTDAGSPAEDTVLTPPVRRTNAITLPPGQGIMLVLLFVQRVLGFYLGDAVNFVPTFVYLAAVEEQVVVVRERRTGSVRDNAQAWVGFIFAVVHEVARSDYTASWRKLKDLDWAMRYYTGDTVGNTKQLKKFLEFAIKELQA